MIDTSTDLEAQKAAFAGRCQEDAAFTKNAVYAVMSNDETKRIFLEELARQSPGQIYSSAPSTGIQMVTPTKITYNLPSVAQQLSSMSVNSPTATPFTACTGGGPQLNLLSYDGDFGGGLVLAAKILAMVPTGWLVTPLVQALFGTKAGLIILIALLAAK